VLDFGGTRSPLVHDGDFASYVLLKIESLFDATLIGTEDDQFILWDIHASDVFGNLLDSVKVIHRDIEKTLNLCRMQVESENAIRPGLGDEVGNQFRRDRHATFVLAILAGVTVVREYGCNPGRAGALERIQHDEQFHQVLIHWRTRRLNDKDVPPADVLIDPNARFTIGEVAARNRPERNPEVLSNALRQSSIRSTTEDLELVVVSVPQHRRTSQESVDEHYAADDSQLPFISYQSFFAVGRCLFWYCVNRNMWIAAS
jgi:hypothetical protein